MNEDELPRNGPGPSAYSSYTVTATVIIIVLRLLQSVEAHRIISESDVLNETVLNGAQKLL